MGLFEEGNNQGKGRPKGSKNQVNKEVLVELINLCAEDLKQQYSTLTTNQKIKVLTAFKEVYRDALTENTSNNINEIKVHIINNEDN